MIVKGLLLDAVGLVTPASRATRAFARVLLVVIVIASWTVASDARAEGELPALLLAQLSLKVASYDRNHAARRRAHPRILVYEMASDQHSVNLATLIAGALRDPEVGHGDPVDVEDFTSAAALASTVDARSASLVILVSGLEGSAAAIAHALSGKDVLTVGTTGVMVEQGAVVGFELRESKPKIVVSVRSASAQNVSFRAELLALARIVP